MKIEEHVKAYEEHRENVFRWAIEIKGIEKSQRTVGLNISRCAIELLAIYLHEKALISEGKQLNHRWFKSMNVLKKLPEFPERENLIEKMVQLENTTEKLSYGSKKPVEMIEEAVRLFLDIESHIGKLRGKI